MNEPSAALRAAFARSQSERPGVSMDKVREAARLYRDLEREAADLADRLRDNGKRRAELQMRTLPDLMHEAGMDKMGLEAEGNLPAYDLSLKPYYKAGIAASWPPEQRAAGFRVLEDHGHSDLIRTEYTISFGRGERRAAERLTKVLKELGLEYDAEMAVAWNTLTALVRTRTEDGKPFTSTELDALGATVGEVVTMKERKSKLGG